MQRSQYAGQINTGAKSKHISNWSSLTDRLTQTPFNNVARPTTDRTGTSDYSNRCQFLQHNVFLAVWFETIQSKHFNLTSEPHFSETSMHWQDNIHTAKSHVSENYTCRNVTLQLRLQDWALISTVTEPTTQWGHCVWINLNESELYSCVEPMSYSN